MLEDDDYELELFPCPGCGKLIAESALVRRCDRCRSNFQYKKKRGITRAEYQGILISQNGVCAICKNPDSVNGRSLAVDHDHSCCGPDRACTKCVRGLLCTRCNMGLGYFQDDPKRLTAAIEYLQSSAMG